MDNSMNKELSRHVMRAIVALVLIVLIKIAALAILRDIEVVFPVLDIVLSLAVIMVLLKFRKEFNSQLAVSSKGSQGAQSIVSGLVFLLVILALYGTFIPYSSLLPYGLYQIIFFFLVLVPIYSLWNLLYRHTDRLSDFFGPILYEEKKSCSCGWENPGSAKFCNRCGSILEEKKSGNL